MRAVREDSARFGSNSTRGSVSITPLLFSASAPLAARCVNIAGQTRGTRQTALRLPAKPGKTALDLIVERLIGIAAPGQGEVFQLAMRLHIRQTLTLRRIQRQIGRQCSQPVELARRWRQ